MEQNDKDYGIVIAGHGSRDEDGVREFKAAVELLKERNPDRLITYGFLEFAKPTIDEAIAENIRGGSKAISMVPGILLAASHGKNDMPIEMLMAKKEHPEVDFYYGSEMGIDPLLLKLFQERIIQAEAKSEQLLKRKDTLLVVVGRGTTDPDANSEVYKLTRMIEEGMGFGGSHVCYSGTAEPLVADGVEYATTMGFKRIVVIPFFLFTGVLVKRIYDATDGVAAKHPEVEILKASYLGVKPEVADCLAKKAGEAFEGLSVMNCSLCKYRTQIIGFEAEQGMVQEAHHLHVRGGEKTEEEASEPHDHSHAHHHHGHGHHDLPAITEPYQMHPIEEESFQIIEKGYDWSTVPTEQKSILQRLVHTSGQFDIVDDVIFSKDAVQAGLDAIDSQTQIVTDVTMVRQGLRRTSLEAFGLDVYCSVHDEVTYTLASANNITRSAAGIRQAWEKYGDNCVLAIGDAPTAVVEAVQLIKNQGWRPKLVIGLPVGFVGTRECKDLLSQCEEVPFITNRGTRGGSPWAASVINALMIEMINQKSSQNV